MIQSITLISIVSWDDFFDTTPSLPNVFFPAASDATLTSFPARGDGVSFFFALTTHLDFASAATQALFFAFFF